ncbi:transmembrane protein 242-like isoform X2 [Varroa jacobsoni]|uniref:Transmembrane protein 242 n=1 Tax=Varroa destructor TaxID=109461 RepID=A0A7M7JBG5_VARDE|nr:transmembrane protein 242-like isoform X2 [Varroa destructor]XP_022692082.1 transmembrane protein 242-like isoform X2 [Varroa jacobsoni]
MAEQEISEIGVGAKTRTKIPEIVFMGAVAGFSLLLGFGATIAMAKKHSPKYFAQGMVGSKEMPESGTDLALRALGRGTLYAVGGFGLFCGVVWKALNLKEFRQKVGEMLPRIPKTETGGRTEFESLRDFLQYCIDESEKSKRNK